MIEYPKYPDHLNKRLKIADDDRIKIKKMVDAGMSKTEIAKIFKVSPTTVDVCTKTKEEMRKKNRASYLKRRNKLKLYYQNGDVKARCRANEQRKRELMGPEIREYYKVALKKWRKKRKIKIPA